MFIESTQRDKLFALLYAIDVDLAEQRRRRGCRWCGGSLQHASYERKPRGGPPVPDAYCVRFGLCCVRPDCRRRTLPASTLFFGRRVYWGCVLLVVVTLRQQRPEGYSINRLCSTYGVSRKTVLRWMAWFAEVFPRSSWWQQLRGRVSPSVSDQRLPGGLLTHLVDVRGDEEAGLVACLLFLATGDQARQEQAS